MFGALAFGWYDLNFSPPTPPTFFGEVRITAILMAGRLLGTASMTDRMAGVTTLTQRVDGTGSIG